MAFGHLAIGYVKVYGELQVHTRIGIPEEKKHWEIGGPGTRTQVLNVMLRLPCHYATLFHLLVIYKIIIIKENELMARKNIKSARHLNGPMGKGHIIVPVLKPIKHLPADLNPQLKA